MFDEEGCAVFQNANSVEFMGKLDGYGVCSPQFFDTVSPPQAQHPLALMCALDSSSLQSMWQALHSEQTWKGIVRVQPIATQQQTSTTLKEHASAESVVSGPGSGSSASKHLGVDPLPTAFVPEDLPNSWRTSEQQAYPFNPSFLGNEGLWDGGKSLAGWPFLDMVDHERTSAPVVGFNTRSRSEFQNGLEEEPSGSSEGNGNGDGKGKTAADGNVIANANAGTNSRAGLLTQILQQPRAPRSPPSTVSPSLPSPFDGPSSCLRSPRSCDTWSRAGQISLYRSSDSSLMSPKCYLPSQTSRSRDTRSHIKPTAQAPFIVPMPQIQHKSDFLSKLDENPLQSGTSCIPSYPARALGRVQNQQANMCSAPASKLLSKVGSAHEAVTKSISFVDLQDSRAAYLPPGTYESSQLEETCEDNVEAVSQDEFDKSTANETDQFDVPVVSCSLDILMKCLREL
eukprot:gene23086-30280_t